MGAPDTARRRPGEAASRTPGMVPAPEAGRVGAETERKQSEVKDDCQGGVGFWRGRQTMFLQKETRKNGAKAIFEQTAADNLS